MGKGGRDWESYKMNLTLFTTKEERMSLIPILFPLKYSVVESRNWPEEETFNPKNLEIYIMFHSMKISNNWRGSKPLFDRKVDQKNIGDQTKR